MQQANITSCTERSTKTICVCAQDGFLHEGVIMELPDIRGARYQWAVDCPAIDCTLSEVAHQNCIERKPFLKESTTFTEDGAYRPVVYTGIVNKGKCTTHEIVFRIFAFEVEQNMCDYKFPCVINDISSCPSISLSYCGFGLHTAYDPLNDLSVAIDSRFPQAWGVAQNWFLNDETLPDDIVSLVPSTMGSSPAGENVVVFDKNALHPFLKTGRNTLLFDPDSSSSSEDTTFLPLVFHLVKCAF